jgi:hypothetical protein
LAAIRTPDPDGEKVTSVSKYLQIVDKWARHQKGVDGEDGFLSQLWYRGVNQHFSEQIPGVYRKEFTERAERLKLGERNLEEKRLHLEREMVAQFRIAGAAFLAGNSQVEIYFTAQHFGMPTRLLDWSTNPLAGLFFACEDTSQKDGVVYAMDAREVIPNDAKNLDGKKQPQAVMSMHHAFVEYAIKISFWTPPKPKPAFKPYVVPVRPDVVPGRLGQQSSCFTLHVHGSDPVNNKSLRTISVDKNSKGAIRGELHRLNINQFTIYYDLDHLSKEIRSSWGVTKPIVSA